MKKRMNANKILKELKKEEMETRKDFSKILKKIDEYNAQSTWSWATRKIEKPDMELYHYLRGQVEIYDSFVEVKK